MSDVLPGRIEAQTVRPPGGALSSFRARMSSHGRVLVEVGGRVAVVLMAVSVVAAAAHPIGSASAPAIALVTAIWIVSLRAAAANAPIALGPRVPAAVGR